MEQVADAIKFFEKDIRSAGISEQQANTAKYILCATADDIVQHIPTEDRHVWTQYSMLSRFFGERIGGVRFFEILDHAQDRPAGQLSACSNCSTPAWRSASRACTAPSPNGVASLQMIQRNLYETLRRVRPKVDTPICRRTGRARHWPAAGSACAFRSGWSRRSSPRC